METDNDHTDSDNDTKTDNDIRHSGNSTAGHDEWHDEDRWIQCHMRATR
jgi:hypothetical protein